MVLSCRVFRWGDYPEKLEAAYIQSRVESGVWFDNAEKFKLVIFLSFGVIVISMHMSIRDQPKSY
jgi:hypothetical protein